MCTVCFTERPIYRAKYEKALAELAELLRKGEIEQDHYDEVLGRLIGVELDPRDATVEEAFERRMRGG